MSKTPYPAESKVAMIAIALMEVAWVFQGCNHGIQVMGLAAISGLGGFSLGVYGSGNTKSKQ